MATPRKTRLKVGIIGLGIIGTRVAANLRGAGHQVYVWSRSPHSAPNFLGSVVEVADLCDMIQIFVSDDAALLEVIRTIAAALSSRHVLTVHATVSPQAVRQAASIVESQGARYLDAPFTGSKMAAQNRQLVYYVGGEVPALEEVRPVLEVTSKKILHVGRVGDATVLKIATNMLTASTVQTLSEMIALVRASGIDAQRLVEALENNGSRSGTSDLKLPSMIAGDFEPHFSLKHMLKDVRLALGIAEGYKVPVPVADATARVLAGGVERQWGDLDFGAVAKNYDALRPAPPVAKPSETEPPTPTPAPALPPPTPSVAANPDPAANGTAKTPLTGAAPTLPQAVPADTPAPPAATAAVAPVNGTDAAPLPAPASAPIGGDPTIGQPRKTTLRVIRDFFKPAQS